MATELQQLGTFLGNKFDDLYDGVTAVGEANLVNGQTADQIKTSTMNTLKDGVAEDGNTLNKLRNLISGLQALVNGDDINLDSIKEISDYIKANKDLIDAVTAAKADKVDVYTKAEADDLLALKAVAADVYTKLETYSRTEIDTKDSLKANTTDVNNGLATKVNITDVLGTIAVDNKVVTENDVDTAISGKADTTYVDAQIALQATITYVDAQLALKANTTYVDAQDALKVNVADVDGTIDNATNKIPTQNVVDSTIATAIAPKADKTYVDGEIANCIVDSDTVSPVDADNKVVTETELTTGLALKADQATTYTKAEVDAKESALNTADTNLQTQITQVGTYAEFVAAFDASLLV